MTLGGVLGTPCPGCFRSAAAQTPWSWEMSPGPGPKRAALDTHDFKEVPVLNDRGLVSPADLPFCLVRIRLIIPNSPSLCSST